MSANGVEEDWQVVIGIPEPDLEAPQLGTLFTPDDTNPNIYGIFKLNYRDEPSFSAGGLELEAWNNTSLLGYSAQGTALLQTNNEKIGWTERMTLSGSTASYQVINGKSTTWGNFGGGGNLAVAFSTTTASFSNFSPVSSVNGSDVSYGDNSDVTSWKLVQVRYFQDASLSSTDTNSRSVDLTA